MFDAFIGPWNSLIVGPLMSGLRFFAGLFEGAVNPGIAAGLAIIAFTVVIRLVLLPLSLQQVKSQKEMMKIQPLVKDLQRKFKNDREGLAKAQMALYKEHGVNPAAGCLPMLPQMPILFGMYWAMFHLSTGGLTLDRVQPPQVQPGRVVYEATRAEDPLPVNQFILGHLTVVPTTNQPVTLSIEQEGSYVRYSRQADPELLVGTQSFTLTPGQVPQWPNPPNTPDRRATLLLRQTGAERPDGISIDHNIPVREGEPYRVDIWVNANQQRVDTARAVVTYDPALATVGAEGVSTPAQRDIPFKSAFLWLPSLGEPDLIPLFGIPLPGLLLLLMTVTTWFTTRMTMTVSDDPQQKAMMQMMQYMPLMYLFFFSQTPAGLVLYWLVSNFFTIGQQFFTTGLGQLRGDLMRLTGRDLQPPWARQGLAPLVPRSVEKDDDGSTGGADGSGRARKNGASGTSGSGVAVRQQRLANERRTHPTVGRGRKRGKR